MESEKVSIIVPLFNAEVYLKAFIDSVINQTYKNWELIIVDDGSTDKGPDLVKKYEAVDKRIKYIKRDLSRKKGGNTCRNIGFENAQGKFIIWFDADDIVAPYALEQRVKFMERNPNLDFAVFPALGFNDKLRNWNWFYFGYNSENKALNNLINKYIPFAVWTNIYNKDSLIKKKIQWDENLISLQDSDFNITCLTSGLSFKECKAPADYFWRNTEGSVTQKIFSEKHCLNHIYLLNKLSSNNLIINKYKHDLKFATLWTINILSNNSPDWKKYLNTIKLFNKNTYFTKKVSLLFSNKININSKKGIIKAFSLFPKTILKTRKNQGNFPFHNAHNQNRDELINITERMLSQYNL
ncbi:MAG: glycosyltransferase family 2 protein [Muribaculaceae bacterium]|nr:glycosyltransferase family 2 protein [Muribaculaceae bacterium]